MLALLFVWISHIFIFFMFVLRVLPNKWLVLVEDVEFKLRLLLIYLEFLLQVLFFLLLWLAEGLGEEILDSELLTHNEVRIHAPMIVEVELKPRRLVEYVHLSRLKLTALRKERKFRVLVCQDGL